MSSWNGAGGGGAGFYGGGGLDARIGPQPTIWAQRIGLARAKEYLFTGEVLTAQKAAEIGLVNHCVPADQLDQVLAPVFDVMPPAQLFGQPATPELQQFLSAGEIK